jgi:hypothetical protein
MLTHLHIHLLNFPDDISIAVTSEMQDITRTTNCLVTYLDSLLPRHTSAQVSSTTKAAAESKGVVEKKVVSDTGQISLEVARMELAKHLLSSQSLSCTRLSDCVQNKLPLLQHFNNTF